MDQKRLLEILKSKNNDLKYYITEREVVRTLKSELEIQIACEQTSKDLLILENDEYDDEIQTIKDTRKNVIVCTAIFYIFLIVNSFIGIANILTPSFYMAISMIPIMTIAYIISIAKNMNYLKNNKIKFFKRRKKDNNERIKTIDDNLITLNKELQDIIKRDFECRKLLEKYTLEMTNLFRKEENNVNEAELSCKVPVLTKKI